MEVGDKLNPQRSYRKGFALKGLRHHITFWKSAHSKIMTI